MAWTAPKTWVAGNVWTSSDANTYIRDNFSSTRHYVNSTGQFSYNASAISTTSSAIVGTTHYGLGSSTPDEAFTLIVLLNGFVTGAGTSPVPELDIVDQTGSSMTPHGFLGAAGYVASSTVAFSYGGQRSYAASTSPGFAVVGKMLGASSTGAFYGVATYWIVPVA